MHISKQIRETDAHLETDKAVLYVTANNRTMEINTFSYAKKGGFACTRRSHKRGTLALVHTERGSKQKGASSAQSSAASWSRAVPDCAGPTARKEPRGAKVVLLPPKRYTP